MEPGKRLPGKVAIITGGASGIGEATARIFASHGASVVLCDLQDELGAGVAADIGVAGGIAEYRHLDVTQENEWSALVGAVEAKVRQDRYAVQRRRYWQRHRRGHRRESPHGAARTVTG